MHFFNTIKLQKKKCIAVLRLAIQNNENYYKSLDALVMEMYRGKLMGEKMS